MNRDKVAELYKKYELEESDVFKHKHYLIITRSGIEKIQAKEQLIINYEVVRCEPNYAAVKATCNDLQTFGSAFYGDVRSGATTNSGYVLELAEKRAMSRAVLKTTGFYQLGVFSEDESDEFKKQ